MESLLAKVLNNFGQIVNKFNSWGCPLSWNREESKLSSIVSRVSFCKWLLMFLFWLVYLKFLVFRLVHSIATQLPLKDYNLVLVFLMVTINFILFYFIFLMRSQDLKLMVNSTVTHFFAIERKSCLSVHVYGFLILILNFIASQKHIH